MLACFKVEVPPTWGVRDHVSFPRDFWEGSECFVKTPFFGIPPMIGISAEGPDVESY